MNYFVRNLETRKMELHFDRATYQALSAERKEEIKQSFLWAKSRAAWVSRGYYDTSSGHWALEVAKRLGLEDRGESGERLSFAEQQDQKALRAEDRADRFEHRAQAATAEAHRRFNSDNIQTLRAMQGEPVKLGHHSARRHLRLIEKADKDMDKGCEAYQKSQHYASRAEVARQTASQAQLDDPAFLDRRIKEGEAESRQIQRLAAEHPESAAYLDRLEGRAEELLDRLTFYRECLETLGGVRYSKANVKPGDLVLIRGDWQEVVRANPTTVAVPNTCYPAESQRKWPLKYPYAEIKDHRPAAARICE